MAPRLPADISCADGHGCYHCHHYYPVAQQVRTEAQGQGGLKPTHLTPGPKCSQARPLWPASKLRLKGQRWTAGTGGAQAQDLCHMSYETLSYRAQLRP